MPATMANTRDRIRNYLFGTLIPTPREAWPADDADLFENGMDSLRLMQILVFIEQDIGVHLPDEEVTHERMSTVRSIVEFVGRHRRN